MRAAPLLAAWALLAALPPAVLDDPIADLDIYNPHYTAVATAEPAKPPEPQGPTACPADMVLVVDRSGACVYAHFSEVSGDLPPMEDVLAAARQLERPNTRSKI